MMATTMMRRCAGATARRGLPPSSVVPNRVVLQCQSPSFHRFSGVTARRRGSAAVADAAIHRPVSRRGLASSSSSSSSSVGGDGGGVVVTRASEEFSGEDKSSTKSDPDEDQSGQGGRNSPDGPPDPQRQQRPVDRSQQAEERIAELQRHVRVHHQQANYGEALKSSRELLRACVEAFGDPFPENEGVDGEQRSPEAEAAPPHPATASAYNNVGLMHKLLGEFDASRTHYDRALLLYGEVVGTDHASYAAALHNLGGLDRTQSTVDEALGGEERVALNERAAERFEGALKIREVELGRDHPHAVASRSSLGVAMAAAILGRVGVAAEAARQLSEEEAGTATAGAAADSDVQPAPLEFSKESWEVAEKHLREAVSTAIRNPRGELAPSEAAKVNVKGKDRSKSKKERASKANSKKKRGKGQELLRGGKVETSPSREKGDATTTDDVRDEDNNEQGDGDGGPPTEIRTLSAASAAQNLAVFLKSRADVALHPSNPAIDRNLDRGELYAEAIRLYRAAWRVRSRLLREGHPDAVATKFSLAEAMEAVGDKDGADKLREEILGDYGVEEREADGGEGGGTEDGGGDEAAGDKVR